MKTMVKVLYNVAAVQGAVFKPTKFLLKMTILLFQGGVFIHEIHAGGAAEKTGMLHHGDLVTKVETSSDSSSSSCMGFLLQMWREWRGWKRIDADANFCRDADADFY